MKKILFGIIWFIILALLLSFLLATATLTIVQDLEVTKNLLTPIRSIIYLLALIIAIIGVKAEKLPGTKTKKHSLETSVKKKVSPYAVASLVFGLITWIIMAIVWVNIWIFGLIAIGASEKFKSLNKQSENKLSGHGIALAGTILGVISSAVFAIAKIREAVSLFG